jgi:hypothetical protein
MTNNSNFFLDPKVLISILAILISIASFLSTLANQWEQNRRWDKLNTANVIVKRAILKRYKSITKADALATNWGYKPIIYGSDIDNEYIIPYKLVVVDKLTDKLITTINAGYTVEEIKQELIRINYQGEGIILMHFEPKFEIENKGKTDAKNLNITVDSKRNGIDWYRVFSSDTKIELSGDQISTIELEMDYPISMDIPDEILFKIKLSYLDIHENEIEKEFITKWISKNNSWSYSN